MLNHNQMATGPPPDNTNQQGLDNHTTTQIRATSNSGGSPHDDHGKPRMP
jgi:hypothetical protein